MRLLDRISFLIFRSVVVGAVENVEKILESFHSKTFSDRPLWKSCGKTKRVFHRGDQGGFLSPQTEGVFHKKSTGFSTELSTDFAGDYF